MLRSRYTVTALMRYFASNVKILESRRPEVPGVELVAIPCTFGAKLAKTND